MRSRSCSSSRPCSTAFYRVFWNCISISIFRLPTPRNRLQTFPGPAQPLPFKALVWRLEDKTPDTPGKRTISDLDGKVILQTNLTRGGSAWRSPLSMMGLSKALAAEVRAKLADTVLVSDEPSWAHSSFEYEAQGARLFIAGEVDEASWTRTWTTPGSYKLKVRFSASLTQPAAPAIEGFWKKELEAEVKHEGWPSEDLDAALAKIIPVAVDDLAKAMTKEPVATAAMASGPSAENADK